MNFIPIIILMLFLMNNKESSLEQILSLVDTMKDNPLIHSFMEGKGNPLQSIMKGEFKMENIVQLISLASGFGGKKNKSAKPDDVPDLKPIENIASEEITDSLEKYLNNA